MATTRTTSRLNSTARVPAVVISPLDREEFIDHRVYDHASVPRTAEKLFGLPYLTERDHKANDVLTLVTLPVARTDTPTSLPGMMEAAMSAMSAGVVRAVSPPVSRPEDTVNEGNLPAVVNAAMQQHLQAEPEKRDEILDRVANIHTRAAGARLPGGVKQIVKPATSAAQAGKTQVGGIRPAPTPVARGILIQYEKAVARLRRLRPASGAGKSGRSHCRAYQERRSRTFADSCTRCTCSPTATARASPARPITKPRRNGWWSN